MLSQEDFSGRVTGNSRKTYSRSVSWTDRSCSEPNRKLKPNGKPRLGLPPLQPLSISRRPVEEWPRASSDDLGVWPCNNNSQTPREEFQLQKDKVAFFGKECSRITDHIYLGSDAVAKNRELLRQNRITHVLNCVGFVCPEYFKSDLVYKTLWLRDTPSEDIISILYDVFDYFEDVREKGGRVLVHCFQGVSRSASLVIAYLMWREGQSFEDALQCVKAARGITNPNMGFACQLLQCQKRVHALPPSPSSLIRMYRMAPHSSYDPLHLVAKLLNHTGSRGLDSRGAFIVNIPSAIYVWIGKHCGSVMSDRAKKAASQVVRYERAQGPIVTVNEGEEPLEFWEALINRQPLQKEENLIMENWKAGEKRVYEYDLDFEIFHKALAGGVVPPLSVSDSPSETCVPARENGWGNLDEKFSNSVTKFGLELSPTLGSKDVTIDPCEESENLSPVNYSPASSPSGYPCGTLDSFECFPNSSSPEIVKDSCNLSQIDPLSPAMPSLSPSTSDYASSLTFSPSSSNWSENLSYLSSCQPSPSSFEAMDIISGKIASLADYSYLPSEKAPAFSFNCGSRLENSFPCRNYLPSIAERRGSNPPPPMMMPRNNEAFKSHGRPVGTRSFSFHDVDCDQINGTGLNQLEEEGDRDGPEFDAQVHGS